MASGSVFKMPLGAFGYGDKVGVVGMALWGLVGASCWMCCFVAVG